MDGRAMATHAVVGVAAALFALLLPQGSIAGERLQVSGVARLSDGTPIEGGQIVVRRIRGPLWGRVTTLGRACTDASGRFAVDVPAGRGLLDIELERRPCRWSVGVAQVALGRSVDGPLQVEVEAVAEACPQATDTPPSP